MAIPAPLAYPPTALRNVAAGLVVGNPVGSSGTRAKALTSAELKAIVEASGISYLPLSGGTLTGDVTAGSNSLTAAKFKLGATSASAMLKQGASTEAGNVEGAVVRDATDAGYMAFHARRLTASEGLIGCWSSSTWNGWVIYRDQFVGTNAGRISWVSGSSSLAGTEDLILLRGGAGILEQRNGLNAQCFDLFETYTSSTNNGKLRFKATSSGHQIGSARASSGSNRAVQLGHFDSGGTFTSGLSIATDGAATFSGAITPATLTDAAAPNGSIYYSSTQSKLVYKDSGGTVNVLY